VPFVPISELKELRHGAHGRAVESDVDARG
jgi:hypothetical protein